MLLDFCFFAPRGEDIFSWNWGRKAVEDVTSTGHCETPSSLRFWRGGQGSPGSQLSRPLQTPPPNPEGPCPSPRALLEAAAASSALRTQRLRPAYTLLP